MGIVMTSVLRNTWACLLTGALSAPALAGQLAPYLAAQLKLWQQGGRKNDAGSLMTTVVARLDDADIAAVTSYYAGLDAASR